MDSARIRQLLDKRDAIDREILELVNGDVPKKTMTCSICGGPHTARTCPQKPANENTVSLVPNGQG
jgi:hypothetical protein